MDRLWAGISILVRSICRVHVRLDGSKSTGKEKDSNDQDHDEPRENDADKTVPSETLRRIFADHNVAVFVRDHLIRHVLLLYALTQVKAMKRFRMSANEQIYYLFSFLT